MSEEELKKGCGKEIEENDKEVITCGNSLSYNGKLPTGKWKKFKFRLCPTCKARLEGFQKGKLEVINKLKKKFKSNITVISKREFLNELEQLQKEIGGKKTSEEKQDE